MSGIKKSEIERHVPSIELEPLLAVEVRSPGTETTNDSRTIQSFHWGRCFKYLKSAKSLCYYSLGLLNLSLSPVTGYLTYDILNSVVIHNERRYTSEEMRFGGGIVASIFTIIFTVGFAAGGVKILVHRTRKAIKEGYTNDYI